MDPNTALETAKESAKAFTKLGDIVEKFFGPNWTRKQADADKYANDKKLELIRENPDMEIIFVNGEMSAREKNLMELEQRADKRLLTEKIRQEVNLEKVLDIAAKDLEFDDTEVDEDNNVDDDWIVRLFNIVKDVSNEDMQFLWGKILAGEIKQPGSFSFRTIETIRNISKKEAETFQKVLPIIANVNDKMPFIVSDSKILKENGVNYDDILLLDEAGLVNLNELVTTVKIIDIPRIILYNKEYVIIAHPINNYVGECKIYEYSITKTGYELYKLLSQSSSCDYMKSLSQKIVKDNEGKFKLTLHTVKNVNGDIVSYESTPIETFE